MKKSILFLALLQSLLIVAQAPQKMSYQSVVRNAANQIVANQSIGVKISIIEGSLTGTTVYAERHTTTTNPNGLFTLEAGGGTPTIGTFATINWGNGSHYIKSEIDVTGGTNYTLSGTMELLSVPYALNGITTEQADAIAALQVTNAAMQAQIATMQTQITSLLPTPQLTTDSTSEVKGFSAVSGGAITYTGIGFITARGVVWSTSPSPTIALSTKTTDGLDTYSFTSTITGLTPETTYYVRAYVTNNAGTVYGNEVSFVTNAKFTIGLHPELGGYVFSVSENGQHGLVVETQDQGSSNYYGAESVIDTPAKHSVAGQQFTDWRLPTIDELNQMYTYRNSISGLINYYWSSTEIMNYGIVFVYSFDFSNGYNMNNARNSTCYVRGVRAF